MRVVKRAKVVFFIGIVSSKHEFLAALFDSVEYRFPLPEHLEHYT